MVVMIFTTSISFGRLCSGEKNVRASALSALSLRLLENPETLHPSPKKES